MANFIILNKSNSDEECMGCTYVIPAGEVFVEGFIVCGLGPTASGVYTAEPMLCQNCVDNAHALLRAYRMNGKW